MMPVCGSTLREGKNWLRPDGLTLVGLGSTFGTLPLNGGSTSNIMSEFVDVLVNGSAQAMYSFPRLGPLLRSTSIAGKLLTLLSPGIDTWGLVSSRVPT